MRSHRHRCLALSAAAFLGLTAGALTAGAARTHPLSPQAVQYWTAVAACETGSGGPPKWDWGSKHRPGEGTHYQGGLGISVAMWTLWAGEVGILPRYPHAYDAPPLVQMEVAEYGVETQHAKWGCKG